MKSRFVGIRINETDGRASIDEILKGIRRDHGATRERHTKVALNSVLTDAVLAGRNSGEPSTGTRHSAEAQELTEGEGRASARRPSSAGVVDGDQRVRAVLAEGSPRPRNRARGHRCCDGPSCCRCVGRTSIWMTRIPDDRRVGGEVEGPGPCPAGHDQGRGRNDRFSSPSSQWTRCTVGRVKCRGRTRHGVIFPSSTGTAA